MAQKYAIGIDLGTTESSVAIFQNGRVNVIPNDYGNASTPSYVAFTNTERLIGDNAKNQASMNATNTVFDVKRLIGRQFTDPIVQSEKKYWPFDVINDNGKPKMRVTYKGEEKSFCAEEISAMLLSKMREMAENYVGAKITNAVITVPSYFNNCQRQATKDAATIAGLNTLRIINEPTAAALALVSNQRFTQERIVLILDLGGGTCNVSIIAVEDEIFDVRATAGNNQLGGEDFINRLVGYFKEEFRRKYKKNLTGNNRALSRLRTACEKAKCSLSTCAQTTIEICNLFENIDFKTTITREKFEELNRDLFYAVMELVVKSLKDAKLEHYSIHDIVLIGGSTRIPKIQRLLKDFFRGRELNKSLNPVESVVCGAAIEAAILNGDKSKNTRNMLLLDVTSISLGIEVEGVMEVVIKRNTNLPVKRTNSYTFKSINKKNMLLRIFEGEDTLTKNNHLLGELQVGISPINRHQNLRMNITFDIDCNSILKVTALEINSGKQYEILISNEKTRLSREEICRMVKEAEEYRKDDEKQKNRTIIKNNLEAYCFEVKRNLESYISEKCNEVLDWLEDSNQATEEEFSQKHKELENFSNKLMKDTEQDFKILSVKDSCNELKCGKCNKFLSYLPVYVAKDKLSICGRCSYVATSDDTYFQNSSYESVAKILKFPCVYHNDGCVENLSPSEVPHHENVCSFRTVTCMFDGCNWKNNINGFYDHIEEKHLDLILGGGKFEIDFINCYELSNILIYQNEIFGLKRRFDNKRKILKCSLSCYKVLNDTTQYTYQITITNPLKNLSFTFPRKCIDNFENKENITEIIANDTTSKLDNPTVIIGSIKIFKSLQKHNSDSKKEPTKSSPNVNYGMLMELECPVCFHFIIPPIFQCLAGHSICEDCKKRIVQCPICKEKFKDVHNVTLEKMANLLIYPCRFTEKGCDFTSTPQEIKQHQASCSFNSH